MNKDILAATLILALSSVFTSATRGKRHKSSEHRDIYTVEMNMPKDDGPQVIEVSAPLLHEV